MNHVPAQGTCRAVGVGGGTAGAGVEEGSQDHCVRGLNMTRTRKRAQVAHLGALLTFKIKPCDFFHLDVFTKNYNSM